MPSKPSILGRLRNSVAASPVLFRYAYGFAALWMVVVGGLGLRSLSTPIYLLHPSPLMTGGGVRIVAVDGVFAFYNLSMSRGYLGEKGFLYGQFRMTRFPSISNPQWLTPLPEEDQARFHQMQVDPSGLTIIAPRINLRGPDLWNAGGFEHMHFGIGVGGTFMSIHVICVPGWFVAIFPGMIIGTIVTLSWAGGRRGSRRAGFAIDSDARVSGDQRECGRDIVA